MSPVQKILSKKDKVVWWHMRFQNQPSPALDFGGAFQRFIAKNFTHKKEVSSIESWEKLFKKWALSADRRILRHLVTVTPLPVLQKFIKGNL